MRTAASLCELTPDAVDGEGVQLLLPVLALAGQVGHSLHLTVEQVVQQCQRHLLGRATVGADVQHVGRDDGTAYPHLRWVFLPLASHLKKPSQTNPQTCIVGLPGDAKYNQVDSED